MRLEIGMPVVLECAEGLRDIGLFDGQEGMCNQLLHADGKALVLFMPDNGTRMYYISEERVVINAEKIDAWKKAQEVVDV